MDGYLSWQNKIIDDFSEENLSALYHQGFVFTRLGRGQMTQTRSLRIDLAQFELTSENRRVLKKSAALNLSTVPLPYLHYHWSIGKIAKDFYETKFGKGTFSANKIKELLTSESSNFNKLLVYSIPAQNSKSEIGYCIIFETPEILHYGYPFYDLQCTIPNLGLGMMLRAILHAQPAGKKYVYLGSAQNPAATYKLQFKGLEWFDGNSWQTDLKKLKTLLT